jgi:hypothetical protein
MKQNKRKMNKRGFAGLPFLMGILVAVICIVFSMALTPILVQSFGMARGSNAGNCPGFTDPNGLYSYNATLGHSDSLTCMVTDFGTGLIVLSIIFGIIAGILTGSFGRDRKSVV